MTEPDTDTIIRARRLIGQHPAALRSVSWTQEAADNALHHLEVETKHGQVVVFDHQTPVVYSQPPQPPAEWRPRHWRDLTLDVPVAFAGRPVIVSVDFVISPAAWRLRFSIGAELSFILDASSPRLLINHSEERSKR